MITEIVLFKLPAGMTREEYAQRARESAPAWGANPQLIRKNYLYDAERGYGGGAYTWNSVAEAREWHGEAVPQAHQGAVRERADVHLLRDARCSWTTSRRRASRAERRRNTEDPT